MASVTDHNLAVPLVPATRWEGLPYLRHDELHVWVVGIDARDIGDATLLSAAETQRAMRYRADFDRACFVQRRTALRSILAGYLGVAPQDVVYVVNEFGKPSVSVPPGSAGLSFSTTHSGTVALIAVGRSGRIGIDVERLRPNVEDMAIAARFFSATEAASLAALQQKDRAQGFFNAWTRKEAVVKALGGGLSIPLDSFEVTLRPGAPPAVMRCNVPGVAAEQWRIRHLEPVVGYVGALAWNSPAITCRCWNWTG